MTYRQNSSSSRDSYSRNQSRLSQQIRCDSTDEGCPVIEESGTVCGETNSLSIFQEFRQMYDDCLQNLEGSVNGNATLRKLAPFKKLIDDLWEQNAMLVETVEELEQEATYRVTNLQDRLNKSCQKICDYQEDVDALIGMIQGYCESGRIDVTGCSFKTFSSSSVFKNCNSCPEMKKRESDISCERSSRNASRCGSIILEERKVVKCDSSPGGKSVMGTENKSNLLKNTSLVGCSMSEEKRGVKCDSFTGDPLRSSFPSRKSSIKIESPAKFSSPKSHLSFCDSDPYPVQNNDRNKYGDDLNDDFDCQDCMRAININLNIGKKESFECTNCCDCCCNATKSYDP